MQIPQIEPKYDTKHDCKLLTSAYEKVHGNVPDDSETGNWAFRTPDMLVFKFTGTFKKACSEAKKHLDSYFITLLPNE